MRCSYCFARDQLEANRGGSTPAFISGEAFEARLDFLDRSEIREIRLIGGEPTLHPEFPQIIERARLRGRHVVVFSHGLLSERATTCLEGLAPDDCTIVVNANATRVPDGPTDEERAHRLRVLRRLGQRAIIGFTVDRVDLRLDSLLHLIAESRCRREISPGPRPPVPVRPELAPPSEAVSRRRREGRLVRPRRVGGGGEARDSTAASSGACSPKWIFRRSALMNPTFPGGAIRSWTWIWMVGRSTACRCRTPWSRLKWKGAQHPTFVRSSPPGPSRIALPASTGSARRAVSRAARSARADVSRSPCGGSGPRRCASPCRSACVPQMVTPRPRCRTPRTRSYSRGAGDEDRRGRG